MKNKFIIISTIIYNIWKSISKFKRAKRKWNVDGFCFIEKYR